MLSADYQRAVQLLRRLIPIVFTSDVFALKGGTAINLFMSPVSHLSIDLDPTFLPLGLPRDEALAAISRELDAVRERAAAIGLTVRSARRVARDDTQMLASDGQTEVKVEVNQIFGGSLLPPRVVPRLARERLAELEQDRHDKAFTVAYGRRREARGSRR